MKSTLKKMVTLIVLLLLMLLTTSGALAVTYSGSADPPAHKFSLWYRKPAGAMVSKWESEWLPIGNGFIGAMFQGPVDVECIQFTEKTMWEGGRKANPNYFGGNKRGAYTHLKDVRDLLFAGDADGALAEAQTWLTGDSSTYGCFHGMGELFITYSSFSTISVSGYRRELDLEDGVGRVEFNYKGDKYTREYFVSFLDKVMVLYLDCDAPGKLNLNINWKSIHRDAAISASNGLLLMTALNRTNGGMDFQARAKVTAVGGSISTGSDNVTVSGADSVMIIVSVATEYKNVFSTPEIGKYAYVGNDPVTITTAAIKAASGKRYAQLLASHQTDYKNLYDRVKIDIGENSTQMDKPTDRRLSEYKAGKTDNHLEALLFQYGRYMLITSSREGTLPANLQGVWCQKLNPPWHSDYHFNINVQQNYMPALIVNLAECNVSFIDYLYSLMEPGAISAKEHYNASGWTVSTENTPLGHTAPGFDFKWGCMPMAGAWAAWHAWEHYLYTQDKNFLRNTAYPVMKGASEFVADYLVYDLLNNDGTLVSVPSFSPEHGKLSVGVAMDQQIAWGIFTATIEASEILGADVTFRNILIEKKSKLSDGLRIGKYGQLQEWKADIDIPNNNYTHHVAHLWALYPGNQLSPAYTPQKIIDGAKLSLEWRGVISDTMGYQIAKRGNCWARLWEKDKVYQYIRDQLSNMTLPNFFACHDRGPSTFQIDGNFAYTCEVAEFLMQSHTGEIDLLPALPDEWPAGYVEGLRAQGNYEIDIKWRNGKLVLATVHSYSGLKRKIRYIPTNSVLNLDTSAVQSFTLDASGNLISTEVSKF